MKNSSHKSKREEEIEELESRPQMTSQVPQDSQETDDAPLEGLVDDSQNPGDHSHESELNKRIVELERELEEQKNNALRALADYKNLERRTFEERIRQQRQSKAQVMSTFLPVLDNLDKAEVFIKDPGLKMIKDQFAHIFENAGVTVMDLVGKEFDPLMAEVVDVETGETDNVVVRVLRKGYMLGDTVLQHAQVVVSRKDSEGSN